MKENSPSLNWSCEIHVKLVDDEIIALMKSAGCRSIQLGVESGNNEILKAVGKNITIEEAFSAAKIIKKHKIYLGAFFIVGFPQETESTLNDTISVITAFPSDVVMYSIFTPYIGTELFNYCEQNDIIPHDFDVSLYNHQSPENYFCPNIARDVFKNHIRRLEKTLDRINSRRKLKIYVSREGYLKLKEKGIRPSILRFLHFCRNAIRPR
jgi:anaerobic magnesium-protoporphyrin IX monomethyl ester cyclase